jgi:hypothetical protein
LEQELFFKKNHQFFAGNVPIIVNRLIVFRSKMGRILYSQCQAVKVFLFPEY